MVFLLCGLVACAPKRGPDPGGEITPPALIETERQCLPGEEEIRFRVSDGEELAGRRWHNCAPAVNKVVVAVHGVGFYSAVYRDAGKSFAARGIPFLAFDLRGHGHSTQHEELGEFAGMAVYQRDLRDVVQATRQAYPGARVYVVGTSLGANIATLLFTDEGMAPEVEGLVLLSPVWLRADLLSQEAKFKLGMLKAPGPLFGLWKSGKTECVATTTDDKDNIRCWLDDPLVLKELSLIYLDKSLELSTAAAHAVLAKGFKVPNLIGIGGCDALVVPDMAYNTLATLRRDAKGKNSRFAFYPCGHHALLAGLNRDTVAGDMAAWMESPRSDPQKPLLPSGADDHAMEHYGAAESGYSGKANCCINYQGKKPNDCLATD